MISRRYFNTIVAGGTVGLLTTGGAMAAQDRYKPTVKDGHYTEPWFLESFLDLKDDLLGAQESGKRLAVIWEYAGCPYCRETHLVNFAIPEVTDYIRENFDILQLDYKGSKTVTDFDGKTFEERKFAKIQKIQFTPTIQFFAETIDGNPLEVVRMPGYFRPFHFLMMFQFVRDQGYKTGDYRTYLKAKIATLTRQGKRIPSW